jgi:hypothetical protein
VAKLLIEIDHGEFVRNEQAYSRVLPILGKVRATIHQDLLRLPYT